MAITRAVTGAVQTPALGSDGEVQQHVVGDPPSHILTTVDWQAPPDAEASLAALGKLREVRPRQV